MGETEVELFRALYPVELIPGVDCVKTPYISGFVRVQSATYFPRVWCLVRLHVEYMEITHAIWNLKIV